LATWRSWADDQRQRQQREALIRAEMWGRPVDYRARVSVCVSFFGLMGRRRGLLDLIVRGDAFEISGRFGPGHYYRADDTTIEVVTGLLHNWVEIRGRPGRPAARIWVGRWNMTHHIWHALVRAGAHPAQPGDNPAP
jgi:hypothetical protein